MAHPNPSLNSTSEFSLNYKPVGLKFQIKCSNRPFPNEHSASTGWSSPNSLIICSQAYPKILVERIIEIVSEYSCVPDAAPSVSHSLNE